jgi:hypothetical protein
MESRTEAYFLSSGIENITFCSRNVGTGYRPVQLGIACMQRLAVANHSGTSEHLITACLVLTLWSEVGAHAAL